MAWGPASGWGRPGYLRTCRLLSANNLVYTMDIDEEVWCNAVQELPAEVLFEIL